MHLFTPEVLYADTTSKIRAYGALSKRYAEAGDAHGAVHAAWAADVHTVQAVMWERVMIASPQPDEQFNAIADTVAKALASYAAHPTVTITARDAVEQARLGMAGAFDPVAQRVLAQDYLPLDHLDGLPHPDADAGTRMVASRLNGEDPAVVSAKRRQAAKDCMTVAVSMRQQDRLDDAMQHAWQADWAAFESYLIDAAMQVGDANLASVDLRWALAVDEIGKIQALPTDFVEAVTAIRARLIHSLGSIEGTRLADRFEPLT